MKRPIWPPLTGPLSPDEVRQLGNFNSERQRGLAHTPEYTLKMAAFQERFDRDLLDRSRPDLGTTRIREGQIDLGWSWAWFWMIVSVILAIGLVVMALRPPNV